MTLGGVDNYNPPGPALLKHEATGIAGSCFLFQVGNDILSTSSCPSSSSSSPKEERTDANGRFP